MASNQRKRHENKLKDVSDMGVVDAMKKFMPDSRHVITRIGTSRSESEGEVIEQTSTIRYRRFSVAWSSPMDELGYSYWTLHFVQQPIMPWDDIILCLNTYVTHARNFIHKTFLEVSKSCKYLVMLDSDVIPPPFTVEKLIAMNLPLVGGWYPKKTKDPAERKPVVYNFDHFDDDGKALWKERAVPGEGIEEVDGAGAGFWVMRRDVAEAIGKEPYSMDRCGEDLELCLKVREAGFPIYIDWDIRAEHRGVMSV